MTDKISIGEWAFVIVSLCIIGIAAIAQLIFAARYFFLGVICVLLMAGLAHAETARVPVTGELLTPADVASTESANTQTNAVSILDGGTYWN